jgi:hypothetical protein
VFFYPENVGSPSFFFFFSNVLAGHLFGIPLRGTHSHAYVSSYMVSKISFMLPITNGQKLSIWCSLLSPEHLVVSHHTVVTLAKQFVTTLAAKLHVVSRFKLEDLFSHHTSPQIMNSKSVEHTFRAPSTGAMCSDDSVRLCHEATLSRLFVRRLTWVGSCCDKSRCSPFQLWNPGDHLGVLWWIFDFIFLT